MQLKEKESSGQVQRLIQGVAPRELLRSLAIEFHPFLPA
jgi:hypothetical protein